MSGFSLTTLVQNISLKSFVTQSVLCGSDSNTVKFKTGTAYENPHCKPGAGRVLGIIKTQIITMIMDVTVQSMSLYTE
eukprot:6357418-Amphidinium_carterae.2